MNALNNKDHDEVLLETHLIDYLITKEQKYPNVIEEIAYCIYHAHRAGSVCFDLNNHHQPFKNAEINDHDSLNTIIEESTVIGTKDDYLPIIFDNNKLYFQKYFQAQKNIIDFVTKRIVLKENQNNDALERFLLINGGPGTGKTTYAINHLQKMIKEAKKTLEFCICAPTGKACARLKEALKKTTSLSQEELKKAFSSIMTVHKLLQIGYPIVRSKFNEQNRLAYDVIIIDEASMIDVLMMSKLFQAISDETVLIMLGDFNQLVSIEAGAILKDMSETLSKKTNNVIELTKNYRFQTHSGIDRFAQMIKNNHIDKIDELIQADFSDLKIITDLKYKETLHFILDALLEDYTQFLHYQTAEEAIQKMNKNIILTPLRKGFGSHYLNRYIEHKIKIKNAIDLEQEWFHGRLIILKTNLHQYGLQNGDIGVCLRNAQDDTTFDVHFSIGEKIIAVPTTFLTSFEAAYVLTIHKSQGSEFDFVYILFPDKHNVLLSKEMLYTAVTRARKKVVLFSKRNLIKETIATQTRRTSDIAFHLKHAIE